MFRIFFNLIMKKLFSYVFLSIILLKIGGFIAILSIEREIIRKQVIQEISNNSFVEKMTCIIGSQQNLAKIVWERDNKEFWFDGKLYDVVKTEFKNGLVNYYCISDEVEQKLCANIQYFAQSHSANSPLNEASKDILILIFQQIILPIYSFPSFENIIFFISKAEFLPLLSLYISTYFPKIVAPPQPI